ncbi:MAG: ATP-binding cassette domain-containing protein [Clostridiales bacterium]|nr:ATP-binding cassette domain-containing protein [Clostridiales bacterium]
MADSIVLNNISKEFKVLNRHEGLKGSIKDLFSRDYKTVKAVDQVSLTIKQGEIVGYLGPNGAGKSTTIKIMTGILRPTSGEITVNGRIPWKDRTANCENIGVVFGQRSQLWWSLPLIESFRLLKDIYLIPDEEYKETLDFYKTIVDIEPLLHKPVRQMSLGQRTLSDILASFLHSPDVVFLDEPTIGLDVAMKSNIRNLISAINAKRNTTVILTTHDMGDVDALCRRIVIIDKGRMLYDNDIEHLKKVFGSYRTLNLRVARSQMSDEYVESLKRSLSEYGVSVSREENWISLVINEEKIKVMDVLNKVQAGGMIRDMKLEEISTEEVIKRIYTEGI